MAKQNFDDTRATLLLLWVIFNAVGAAFVFVAWKAEWLSEIVRADTFYLCRGIMGFFVLSMITCTWRTVKMVRELEVARKYVQLLRAEKDEVARAEIEEIEEGNSRVANYVGKVRGLRPEDRYSFEHNLRMSLSQKISGTGVDLGNLISLGIIGTVIGMKLFAGDFTAQTAKVDPNIFDIVRASMPGLNLALTATLLGGIGAFWLGYLFRILKSAKEQLVSTLIEAGVYVGRS